MAIVGAVAAVFGAYTAYKGAGEAKDAAQEQAYKEKEMARESAAAIEAETAESVRRAKDKAAKVEGENRARAGGSGVTMAGSLGIGLDAMSEEHSRQIDWMGKAGASKARMALMGGDMRSAAASARADQFSAQQWGAVAGGVSSVYSVGNTQGAGWWS